MYHFSPECLCWPSLSPSLPPPLSLPPSPSCPPISAGGGGPGFQPSMEQHPGGARSPFDQWSNEPHQQMQLPPFKSNSSASLHLLSEHRADSVTSSISASPWSEMEEYDSRLNDPDFQGSDTSIFARQFKEKQASLPPPPPGPPGMMRSRSLEDIRKVVSPQLSTLLVPPSPSHCRAIMHQLCLLF